MSEVVLVVLVVAAVIATIVSQVKGVSLPWKRVAVLPTVAILIGFMGLSGMSGISPSDVVFITLSAVIAAGIGLVQGAQLHLESRNGTLWGRMPLRGTWWWAALIISRVAVTAAALALGARGAASADALILVLGINRLAQAAVIAVRAGQAGVPVLR